MVTCAFCIGVQNYKKNSTCPGKPVILDKQTACSLFGKSLWLMCTAKVRLKQLTASLIALSNELI